MENNVFSKRLRLLRLSKEKSQKEFSDLVGIPQPTMSAYETGRNKPTIDALMTIAEKCEVSIDWLCGRDQVNSVRDMSDVTRFLYDMSEMQDIKCEAEIHDHIDIEESDATEDQYRWYVRLTVYGNDHKHPLNADLCRILRKVIDRNFDLESYAIDRETFEMQKEKDISYFNMPLTRKEYPDISREERMKRHIDFLNEAYKKESSE